MAYFADSFCTKEYEQFEHSHHAKAGNILASLDNRLAETFEGARVPFNPHSPTPGHDVTMVNGMASAESGCRQCHGSKVALEAIDGGTVTFEDLKPAKRDRMKNVCLHCHTNDYVNVFYKQYDDFVVNYNEKFAKPGTKIMAALRENNLVTPAEFDEEIEWTWFDLWHHEGRRARHGTAMMAPDYSHWHGMYEVAERFYMQLVPQARELALQASEAGNQAAADKVNQAIDEILARPEHE